MSPESFRGSSPEKIDPSQNPIDLFIDTMNKAATDPMQVVAMLQGLVSSIVSAPGVPSFVKESGAVFAEDLKLWSEGKSSKSQVDAPAPPPVATSEASTATSVVNAEAQAQQP